MNVSIIGTPDRAEALTERLHQDVNYTYQETTRAVPGTTDGFDLVFDLTLDEEPENIAHYAQCEGLTVIGSIAKDSLAAMTAVFADDPQCTLFGMNMLPTFIGRDVAELSALNPADADKLADIMNELNWDYQLVDDRVGMVTPRIVCMIINEACYTVQEGTAGMSDIDLGMRLGTNYPMGPFEWADQIGIDNVYELLASLYQDTQDERYKICPLLQKHYLRAAPFYQPENETAEVTA